MLYSVARSWREPEASPGHTLLASDPHGPRGVATGSKLARLVPLVSTIQGGKVRRTLVTMAITASFVLVPASVAGATHTGCEHGNTQTAHDAVPHKNHQAHGSIPYCPPEDAPR